MTAASETLRRIEDGGADVGPLHIPGAPGMTSIAVALLILIVLRWRRDGLDRRAVVEIDDAIARSASRRADGDMAQRRGVEPGRAAWSSTSTVTAGARRSCSSSSRAGSSTASR